MTYFFFENSSWTFVRLACISYIGYNYLNTIDQIYDNQLWKCNQVIIVGFDDNDHAIRELIRFIEMISREFIFEDATQNGGAPNYKCRWL